MPRVSSKENKNIYFKQREKLGLTRETASDLLETIAPERIEKIENERCEPHPDEVLVMSEKYKSPELCNYYCSNQCPIGRQYVPEVKIQNLSQIVLRLVDSLNTVQDNQRRLIGIDEGYGAAKIANMLNEQGIKTKRNCAWSQNAICRILTNELYTGKIINGKEEVEDFLTGVRTTKEESEWLITDKPELRIIEPEIFDKAQEVLKSRHKAFKLNKERQSNKYIFSTLIKCKECGWSFRRTVRTYKNTYIRWVCSGHNGKGVDNCPNAVTIDEAELIQALDEYFKEILKDKKNIINRIVKEFNRIYKKKEDNEQYENELMTELAKLKKTREKYMDMYTDDLISREELNEKIGGMKKKIEKLENELKLVEYNLNKGDQLEEIVQHTFKNIEGITSVADMTNEQLKQIIQKIEVDKEGNVDIYLRIFGDLGLDDSVLISYDHT